MVNEIIQTDVDSKQRVIVLEEEAAVRNSVKSCIAVLIEFNELDSQWWRLLSACTELGISAEKFEVWVSETRFALDEWKSNTSTRNPYPFPAWLEKWLEYVDYVDNPPEKKIFYMPEEDTSAQHAAIIENFEGAQKVHEKVTASLKAQEDALVNVSAKKRAAQRKLEQKERMDALTRKKDPSKKRKNFSAQQSELSEHQKDLLVNRVFKDIYSHKFEERMKYHVEERVKQNPSILFESPFEISRWKKAIVDEMNLGSTDKEEVSNQVNKFVDAWIKHCKQVQKSILAGEEVKLPKRQQFMLPLIHFNLTIHKELRNHSYQFLAKKEEENLRNVSEQCVASEPEIIKNASKLMFNSVIETHNRRAFVFENAMKAIKKLPAISLKFSLKNNVRTVREVIASELLRGGRGVEEKFDSYSIAQSIKKQKYDDIIQAACEEFRAHANELPKAKENNVGWFSAVWQRVVSLFNNFSSKPASQPKTGSIGVDNANAALLNQHVETSDNLKKGTAFVVAEAMADEEIEKSRRPTVSPKHDENMHKLVEAEAKWASNPDNIPEAKAEIVATNTPHH